MVKKKHQRQKEIAERKRTIADGNRTSNQQTALKSAIQLTKILRDQGLKQTFFFRGKIH